MLHPANAEPLPETLDAIANADLITLGPGSLYTSLITNLLVKGIPEALAASKATRVFVCNLMTQANESLGLTASEHIEKIASPRLGPSASLVDKIFDYALINNSPPSPHELLEKYARRRPVPHRGRPRPHQESLGVEPITGNFLHEGDVLRHDYDKLADTVLQLGLLNIGDILSAWHTPRATPATSAATKKGSGGHGSSPG